MGWPDDWVTFRADGSEIPDGARYRCIGNGVVASVAAWIATRMLGVLEA
jgi:site-specific DNA-cytosine methylase